MFFSHLIWSGRWSGHSWRALAMLAVLFVATALQASEPGASQKFPHLPIPSLRTQAAWEKWFDRALERVVAPGESQKAARQIRTLLRSKRELFGADDKIVGVWRVRRLTVSPPYANAYRHFSLSIAIEGAVLRLDKNTGTQRRRGLLYRDLDERYVFLGADYDQEKSGGVHSAVAGGGDKARNKTGVLVPLKHNQLILIFAPGERDGEIYEMTRR